MTTNTNAALPDAVRVPLDSLHADAEYLCARLLDKSLTREEVVTAIRFRIDAAKAALTTAAAVPAEGWVMVPVEPTEEMIIAGVDASLRVADAWLGGDDSKNPHVARWFAMLASAPKAELAPTGHFPDAGKMVAQPAGEYPTLPTRRRAFLCTKCGGRECEPGTLNETHPTCKCGYLGFAEDLDFTADEMRAYVDADRAMLAQAAPTPSEWDVRGRLAASLTCWHRLTGQEAAELVALFQGHPAQAAPAAVVGPSLAGHEAANLHLSAMVDELRELLQDAKRAMTELHQAAIPDESAEGVPAIIPPEAFRKFVDAHAMLCFCMHQRGHNPQKGAA